MKAQAFLAITLLTAPSVLLAEPVFMPQAASVLKTKQFEAGLGGHFGYQTSELVNNAGTTYKNRVWHFPLFVRMGITDVVESRLIIPITHAVDSSEGTVSTRNDDQGLGNIQMSAKWNFHTGALPLAFALDLDLPTANSKNNPAALGWRYSGQIQQGFNAHPHLVADIPVMADRLTAHTHLGYLNTGTYTTANDARFNPSDLMTFGASLDMNLHDKIQGLSLAAECIGNTALNHSKTGGVANGGDRGTVIEAGPSLRYARGAIHTWTGFLIDAGDPTYRAYNYRVSFGMAYRLGAAQ